MLKIQKQIFAEKRRELTKAEYDRFLYTANLKTIFHDSRTFPYI